MRLILVFVVLFGLSSEVIGQLTPEYFAADTIKYEYRTGGRTDSLDFSLSRLLGTTPSGGVEFSGLTPGFDFFANYHNANRFSRDIPTLRPTFTGLPHVGMGYTFGAAGTSVAKLNYQQIFANQFLVNLQFKNDRGNTQLRNGVYRMNEIDLLLMRSGKVWSTSLDFADHINQSNLNNGLDTSADLSLYGLKFQPVQRENAQSKYRHTNLRWKNFIAIAHFDSLSSFGLTTEHRLLITGRSYSETDSLTKYYSLIQFDTLATNDKYQWSQTMHQGGVYLRSKNIFAAVKGEGTYWKYYNQGERDTMEVNMLANVKARFGTWNVELDGKLNLIGAGQGWSVNARLWKTWNRFNWLSRFKIEDRWADPFLRYYSANNYLYNNYGSLTKQFHATLSNDLNVKLNQQLNISFNVSNLFMNNNLFFDSLNWVSTGAKTMHQFTLRASYEPKFLVIQPSYAYTASNFGNFVPQHYGKLRVMAKGKLFKAKKLLAWVGLDAHYYSSTTLLKFSPAMDVYQINGIQTQSGMTNLHLFLGMQIDEFRFFARYENLGYLWNEHSKEVVENYPIPGGLFLVGITWDFFN